MHGFFLNTSWRRAAVTTAVALIGAQAVPVASAHEVEDDGLRGRAGWALGTAGAVSGIDSPQTWPAARLPGVLGSGSTASDRRGVKVEHATVGAVAATSWWPGTRQAARGSLGWHGEGAAHVEQATVMWQQTSGDNRWWLSAGRMPVPMGSVLTPAGHLDRYAQTPLIRQAISDGDWIDDGLAWRWQAGEGDEDGLQTVGLGLWRARVQPGGVTGPVAPSATVRVAKGELRGEGFAMWLQPRSRAAYAVGTSAGHTHNLPDCRFSLTGVSCFSGRSTVLGASVRWTPHEWPWSLAIGALRQQESGTLESLSGQASYNAWTAGGWVDVVWNVAPRWQLGVRAERLTARHDLTGPGASNVARDANLLTNAPQHRVAASLSYEWSLQWRAFTEIGTEHLAGSSAQRWVGVRVLWQMPELVSGTW